LGRKAPSPEKKRAVSEDQEGCEQTSRQTSPDQFESEENAPENKLVRTCLWAWCTEWAWSLRARL